MIITKYNADGTKERKAVGYAGGQCHQATAPYEAFEVPGTVKKTPTAEACLPTPADVAVKQKVSG